MLVLGSSLCFSRFSNSFSQETNSRRKRCPRRKDRDLNKHDFPSYNFKCLIFPGLCGIFLVQEHDAEHHGNISLGHCQGLGSLCVHYTNSGSFFLVLLYTPQVPLIMQYDGVSGIPASQGKKEFNRKCFDSKQEGNSNKRCLCQMGGRR